MHVLLLVRDGWWQPRPIAVMVGPYPLFVLHTPSQDTAKSRKSPSSVALPRYIVSDWNTPDSQSPGPGAYVCALGSRHKRARGREGLRPFLCGPGGGSTMSTRVNHEALTTRCQWHVWGLCLGSLSPKHQQMSLSPKHQQMSL